MNEEHKGVVSWLDALANMPVGRASLLAMIIADTAGTGSLIIFIFWPSLFETIEISKLLLLSFAITAPFIAFGTFTLQAGHAAKNGSLLQTDLGQTIAESIGTHCMWSLLSLLVIGLQKIAPLPGPTPLDPVFAFWGYTAMYVYYMILKSLYVRYEKRWIFRLFFIPLGIYVICRAVVWAHQLGKI